LPPEPLVTTLKSDVTRSTLTSSSSTPAPASPGSANVIAAGGAATNPRKCEGRAGRARRGDLPRDGSVFRTHVTGRSGHGRRHEQRQQHATAGRT
jgi:hypothetical protein